jgi:Na+-driven multidrug efflux pump
MNSKNKANIKLLIKLSIPIFLELILQVLLGNVDKIMVRNDNTANAINQANSIIDMLTFSISVLATGSLILINQYKGAKDKTSEQRIYSIAFYFNLLLSIALGIILFFFSPLIFNLMNVSIDFYDQALVYIRINGSLLFLQGIIMTLASFLRSNALVTQGFIISALSNLTNVLFNALFLYVFKIDAIVAVALGSVISRALSCIALFIMVYKLTDVRLSL